MATERPKTIGDAPEGPEQSGGRRHSDFLGSRGLGEAQGKKVAVTALRLRRSRRSRSSARSSHHGGHVRRVLIPELGRRVGQSRRCRKRGWKGRERRKKQDAGKSDFAAENDLERKCPSYRYGAGLASRSR